MRSKLIVNSKIKNYTIEFVDFISDILVLCNQKNTITFIDKKVKELFQELSNDSFIEIDTSENIKTLNGADFIYNTLTERKANKSTTLVVIGGGILQDLIGFCASTFCRGIDYILIPTTLLAQADSCVGGKTSLNHNGRKNILGTFYPPVKIIICPKFIQTLSQLDLISGLGEIYKFHILQSNIPSFDVSKLSEMIYTGLEYKIDIISRDEFDQSERKFLNFGHTFGHALESISSNVIPHGVAVIVGSIVALIISTQKGYKVKDYSTTINLGLQLLKESGIHFHREWFNVQLLLDIIKSDKKSIGKLTMVLIDEEPIIEDIEDVRIIEQTITKLCEYLTI